MNFLLGSIQVIRALTSSRQNGNGRVQVLTTNYLSIFANNLYVLALQPR